MVNKRTRTLFSLATCNAWAFYLELCVAKVFIICDLTIVRIKTSEIPFVALKQKVSTPISHFEMSDNCFKSQTLAK